MGGNKGMTTERPGGNIMIAVMLEEKGQDGNRGIMKIKGQIDDRVLYDRRTMTTERSAWYKVKDRRRIMRTGRQGRH